MNGSRMILFLGNEHLTGKAYIQTISTSATITTAIIIIIIIITTTTTTTDDYCDDYEVIITVSDI